MTAPPPPRTLTLGHGMKTLDGRKIFAPNVGDYLSADVLGIQDKGMVKKKHFFGCKVDIRKKEGWMLMTAFFLGTENMGLAVA